MNLNEWNDHIDQEFNRVVNTPTDINEHLQDLHDLACECEHVTEFGSRRGVSTRAFLKAPVTLRAYDVYVHEPLTKLFNIAQNVNKDVKYIKGNTLNVYIEETDMLFIDTWHTAYQLKQELRMHGNQARKYLVFHDTHTYGVVDETENWAANPNRKAIENQGLLHVIIEFVMANPHWHFKRIKTNNNGLTILERRG